MVDKKKIRIVDATLRDGMHAVSHQFTPDDVKNIASALDKAGVDTIEVSHGDGLGGSSFQYGFAAASDEDYLEAASSVLEKAKLSVLLLPGIGTKKDLEMASNYGAKVVRVATHCTEADVSPQHIAMAKDKGMEAVGFLMMSHMVGAEHLIEQARIMVDAGADVVYITDSAGAMTPNEVRKKISALKDNFDVEVGFHGHNNLGLAVGNTLEAIKAGATIIDCNLAGLGAGSGNAPMEALVAVLDKTGYDTGIDLFKILDACKNEVRPKMHRPQILDEDSVVLGYAGVYSSFLLHARRASKKYGVDAREILIKLGEMGVVGGQEDIIFDVAYNMSKKK
ncbi:4-hydroxy-2-oxovalerate aldolase [Halanaerobium congolense]|jgi:4-hydroxy-2-oxovalerate aldolase|uniref:4-hydroxy-2-oxovalerate aldolase n=1 Tax=Halanaerobium congolense TaxID=54121 RepID=A0A4R7DYJ6_9FIRM|nr:4-hydroxy-2-oxovalerate aldolase [Halanaerobium congolense]TDS25714.1 4-hydroxy 2-oxovalerate aldolase/4-hydroxy-2-oxovalerate/4-hydroxy-2-oxohexanoate aldolase [Halanaerobium congolense]